jgi:iron complex transport system ATP-binding protein
MGLFVNGERAELGIAVLRAEGIWFKYGSRLVIDDVNVEVRTGELLGLVGPNGAGKTTLLHLLSGYLEPQDGSVYLHDQPLGSYKRKQIAREIAVVPQQTQTAFAFTALQVVLLGRHPYAGFAAVDTEEDVEIARDALRQLSLADMSERRFDELSGGEQRLVLLARALAQRTPILLLDEPLSALDLRHQWIILNLLKKLVADGKAVLATFHDLNAAARWCDRVALIDGGRMIASGDPDEVLQPELLEATYAVPLRRSTTARIDFAVD